jgi:high-affinity iron transporter
MMHRNRHGISRLFALLAALLGVVAAPGAAAQERIRPAYTADFVAQMLDYVSRDYALAVANGKVIDEDEYLEQLVVSGSALEVSGQVKTLEAQPAIRAGIVRLIDLIKAKAPPDAIKAQALKVRDEIFAIAGVAMAPRHWPSLARGKQVFEANCVSCHGAMGDGRGPAAQALTPKPADFLDGARMAAVSPLSAFSAVKQGIQNTAMQGFPGLSEEELWAVSFYVLSLRHRADAPAAGKLDRTEADLWLKATATLPDAELMQALPGSSAERQKLLAVLRVHSDDRR